MGEQKGFWNNATVAGIASAIALSVIGAFAAYFGITAEKAVDTLARMWRFWIAEVALPRWVFWSWAAISTLLFVFVVLRIYVVSTEQPEEPSAKRTPPKPETSSHRTYTTDVLFEWRWRWKSTTTGEVYSISMYCPKCDQQMVASDIRRQGYDRYTGICNHCSYYAAVDGESPLNMHDKVKRAAERKIRTGEWRQVRKSRA
ncbi:hypothetical protein [Paraburkholderia caribensis]|uniref:hypothetical protein n=1 Tax=Paraburkholderia caribensis TaxID=75105 RepID=UPI001D05E919|nr:hypothetical protein [Paraburkholderia caribensis]